MIIAIDFDGTLCEEVYPNIGEPKLDVILKLKEAQDKGHTIILHTLREGQPLKWAIFWMNVNWGIKFNYVNENPKHLIKKYGDSRKIAGDLYVDDRAPGSIDYFLKLKL